MSVLQAVHEAVVSTIGKPVLWLPSVIALYVPALPLSEAPY